MAKTTKPRKKGEKKFTKNQLKFINAFDGDIKKTAKKIGISYDYARRLATKEHILKELKKREAKEIEKDDDGSIADRKERQRFWTSVLRGEPQVVKYIEKTDDEGKVIIGENGKPLLIAVFEVAPIKNRLNASELLGRSNGDFVDKFHHMGLDKGIPQEVTDDMDQKEATNIYLDMVRQGSNTKKK